MRLSLKSLAPAANRRWKNMYTACGLHTCPNTLFMRSVQSRVGISIGETWYCSPDCLSAAAAMRFSALASTKVLEMPHSPRLSIGLVMLSKGYLNDSQLRLAIAESQLHGEELEAILLRLGLANERQLTTARAAQWGYPVLGQERIGRMIESDIPFKLLRNCSAAPLHSSTAAKRLLLGFVYRVDHGLLNALEQMTGFRAEPCFITPTEFAEQMERLTSVPTFEEVVFDDLRTPTQMGKTVGGFAVEVGAREARFAHCQDYAWTRLSGKRQTVDLLFRIKGNRSRNVEEAPISTGVRSVG
jgi:hypothetical protein